MMRAAAADPIWAITKIATSPIRLWRYIVVSVLIVLAVAGLLALIYNHVPHFLQLPLNFLFMAILAWVLFRQIVGPMVVHFGIEEGANATHGTARFAEDREITPLTQSAGGLLIGRAFKSNKLLRYDGPAHLLTIAPTRTGKGVGTVIPNLLTLDRSIVCVDPKGDNTRVAGRARDRFGPVHVLDPFGVTGVPFAAYNPVALLDPAGLDVAEDAATLADALVYDAPGEAGEAHWNDEAKALIAGILLYIVAEESPERRTLATLREYLTLAPDAFFAFLEKMQASRAAGGLAARAANRHLGKSDREATGVVSAAQRHTHFLDSPRMTAVMARSDFAFADLKMRTGSVFLVLPPDRLGAYARWLRLMVSQSLQETVRAKGERTVLYLLDEFAALGYLAPVERAMGLMAGYGVQLWPILQDIHQLRATYGQRAGTFLSNAGVLQVFGVNDHQGAQLVSDLLGSETVIFTTASQALDSDLSGISVAVHHTGRPLLTPDEVRNLAPHMELLFLAGQRPILGQKLRYYADGEFHGLYDHAA
ncbi:MAG: type IV secretory system conjugative DNA transfer family protein [Rhodospirillaceae bacterium]|nr:MAG: type IV secretory system conjugative DNA transfer family protein [Rhodospirillaceae bacterium]